MGKVVAAYNIKGTITGHFVTPLQWKLKLSDCIGHKRRPEGDLERKMKTINIVFT